MGLSVLDRCLSAKGSVWPVVVIEVLVAVDDWIEGFEIFRQVVGFVELISPCAVTSLDAAVEFGGFWRQDEEADGFILAGLLEFGHELAAIHSLPPSTWMALTANGMSAMTLSRNRAAERAVARL